MKIKTDKKNRDAPIPDSDQKFITCFTDASWSPRTKVYGYGIWIKTDGIATTYSSAGRDCKSSHIAEWIGLGQCLSILRHSYKDALKDCILVLQCDCISALEDIQSEVIQLKEKYGIKYVKLKHVKGHTNNRTNRTTVNDIVDKLARQARVNLEVELTKQSWR